MRRPQNKVNGESSHSIVRNTRNRTNNNEPNIDANNDNSENTIFLKLKELWNEREINIINNILLELEDNRKQNNYELKQESLIDAIEIILLRKEEDLTDILKKTTTLLKNV